MGCYIQRVSVTNIAVTGTGNTAITTLTVPATFTPISGGIYDILISAQVPSATDGTIITITNGTISGDVLQRTTGNYARSRALGWRKVLRVQFFDDPSHYVILGMRG